MFYFDGWEFSPFRHLFELKFKISTEEMEPNSFRPPIAIITEIKKLNILKTYSLWSAMTGTFTFLYQYKVSVHFWNRFSFK
jgi:hypothetical protein